MRCNSSGINWRPHVSALLAGLLLLAQSAVAREADKPPFRIAVDVGHYQQKPGATSAHGVSEFHFNLALSQVVAKELSNSESSAFTIGAAGDIATLTDRTDIATKAGATFLLSIHHDSVAEQYLKRWNFEGKKHHYSDDFSGYSLFISRHNVDPEKSLRCASAMGVAMQRNGFHYSEHHSDPTTGEKKEWADRLNGVYYYDNLVVLKTATQPAVLLEAGIIVNRNDEIALKKAAVQHRIAESIHAGLIQCGAMR